MNAQRPTPNAQRSTVKIVLTNGVRASGAILIAAFCFKTLDIFLTFKLLNSWVFAASFVLDLVVGSIILAHPQSRSSALVGGLLFLSYFVYRMSSANESCDCFGRLSLLLSERLVSVVVFGCSLTCILSAAVMSLGECAHPEKLPLRMRVSRLVLLLVGVMIPLSLYRLSQTSPLLGELVSYSADSETSMLVGVLRVTNVSNEPIRILGAYPTCQGKIALNNNVELVPNGSADFKCAIKGSRSLFVVGSNQIVIAQGEKSRQFELHWVAKR